MIIEPAPVLAVISDLASRLATAEQQRDRLAEMLAERDAAEAKPAEAM